MATPVAKMRCTRPAESPAKETSSDYHVIIELKVALREERF